MWIEGLSLQEKEQECFVVFFLFLFYFDVEEKKQNLFPSLLQVLAGPVLWKSQRRAEAFLERTTIFPTGKLQRVVKKSPESGEKSKPVARVTCSPAERGGSVGEPGGSDRAELQPPSALLVG